MRWLLHGPLTSAVADALRERGDAASDAAGLGLADAGPGEVLEAAQKQQMDVMTADPDLVATATAGGPDGPAFGRSIVFLQLEGGDVEQADAVDRLFERYKRLAPGRLYTVTGSRVKIRQLPGRR